jgi:hypothetical protein
LLGILNNHIGAVLIRGMIQKSSNVMDEERIQLISDLLLIGKIESTFKRDPIVLDQQNIPVPEIVMGCIIFTRHPSDALGQS